MATTKKAPTKKSPAKKSTPTKRANSTSKAKAKHSKKLESFHLTHSTTPFLTIAITRQTLYWGILSLVVLIMGLWIIHLQSEINKIYDAIDANNISVIN